MINKVSFDFECDGHRIYGDEKSVIFDYADIDSVNGIEYSWKDIIRVIRKYGVQ